MELLRLVALDPEDLAILSAHLQDALVRVSDLTYLCRDRRFALIARRFDWESDQQSRRRLTGLHFDHVTRVRTRGIERDGAAPPLDLLAITFDEGTVPSGTVTLIFAGGAAIQLEIECIEAQMKDMGPVWAARARPDHPAAPGPL